jgi:transcriptional regulator with XRE-family HTH domain
MAVDAAVGIRLKRRRQEIGVSLRKLSQQTDLTASFLSQVERGKANLSLNSLQVLARALEVPLLYFLSDDNEDGSEAQKDQDVFDSPAELVYEPFIRKESRPKLVLPDPGVTYELLNPNLTGRKMVAICGRLAPGTDNVARRLPSPTEELIYVLSGALLVGLDRGDYCLNPGDSIYFEGESLQKLVCASEQEDAIWISVITPAVF